MSLNQTHDLASIIKKTVIFQITLYYHADKVTENFKLCVVHLLIGFKSEFKTVSNHSHTLDIKF